MKPLYKCWIQFNLPLSDWLLEPYAPARPSASAPRRVYPTTVPLSISHCQLPSVDGSVSSNSYLSPLSLPSKLCPPIPRIPARQTSQIKTPPSYLLILSSLDTYLTRYTTRPGRLTSIAQLNLLQANQIYNRQ